MGEPVYLFSFECPWYDTKVGIAQALKTLKGLDNLVAARREAAYDRKEPLHDFYILGRYWLDTCGNCWKANGVTPKDFLPGMADVVDGVEFRTLLDIDKLENGKERFLSFSIGSDLPSPGLQCAYCGKAWEIGNCHDTAVFHKTEVFPLANFAGKKLSDVKNAYNERTDAIYRMQSDILIRHDRFIDLSPRYPKSKKDWQKGIVKNENGWVSGRDGITDDYVIQEDDEGYFNVWKYYHRDCHPRSVADDPEFLGKDGHFKNLAGAAYADILIKKELKAVGIKIIKSGRTQSEVPFTLSGKLGKFLFVRAWRYWVVNCLVPLEVAKEMYADEVGAKYVRVAGHCGCPPPEEWALPSAEDLKKGMEELGLELATFGELAEVLNSGKIKAPRFVQTYHIDTMPGLKFFVETIRKHGLV